MSSSWYLSKEVEVHRPQAATVPADKRHLGDSYAAGLVWLRLRPNLFRRRTLAAGSKQRPGSAGLPRIDPPIAPDELGAHGGALLFEAAEKPWPLQAFWPLRLGCALAGALPLQALPAMHFPRRRLQASTPSTPPSRRGTGWRRQRRGVAPDLEFNFMTISSMIV
jgi:hypothetical protein